MRKNLLASILALALFLTSCGGGTAAASMRLRKTEGTVGVSDDSGKEVPPRDDLGLYSGYGVDTQTESYAWIDLDSVKLTKLDQDSEIEITKEGKKLDIEVKAGSLFFNVTQPLADDESMNIRTSSMAVGIRGTCGWVTQDTAALLEGTVEVSAGDQSVTINAGEMAVLTDGALEVAAFSNQDIPDFVREELDADEDLAAAILEDSGIDPREASVYPLHVATSKRVFLPDGTLIAHLTTEYDEFGYAVQRASTDYYAEYGRETTTVMNYTNDLETGTRNVTYGHLREDGSLEEETIATFEEPLALGSSDFEDLRIEPDGSLISADTLEWRSARDPQLLSEIRANGGRYEMEGSSMPEFAGYYVIYSYGNEGDYPVSCVTYTADGVMTGYAEFEWAVIDPT